MTMNAEYYCAGCHNLLGGVSLYIGGQVYHPQCVPRAADTECPECEVKDKRIAKLEEENLFYIEKDGEVAGELMEKVEQQGKVIAELEAERDDYANAGLRSHKACTLRAEKAEAALEERTNQLIESIVAGDYAHGGDAEVRVCLDMLGLLERYDAARAAKGEK